MLYVQMAIGVLVARVEMRIGSSGSAQSRGQIAWRMLRLQLSQSDGLAFSSAAGRLLTVAGGQQGLLWLTTSNKDGAGTPVPSDDRVVVVPSQSGGGEGGPD